MCVLLCQATLGCDRLAAIVSIVVGTAPASSGGPAPVASLSQVQQKELSRLAGVVGVLGRSWHVFQGWSGRGAVVAELTRVHAWLPSKLREVTVGIVACQREVRTKDDAGMAVGGASTSDVPDPQAAAASAGDAPAAPVPVSQLAALRRVHNALVGLRRHLKAMLADPVVANKCD